MHARRASFNAINISIGASLNASIAIIANQMLNRPARQREKATFSPTLTWLS